MYDIIDGILYGQGKDAMGNVLRANTSEVDKFLQRFFALFPRMKSFVASAKDEAFKKGYVQTLWGRRRPLPSIFSDLIFLE